MLPLLVLAEFSASATDRKDQHALNMQSKASIAHANNSQASSSTPDATQAIPQSQLVQEDYVYRVVDDEGHDTAARIDIHVKHSADTIQLEENRNMSPELQVQIKLTIDARDNKLRRWRQDIHYKDQRTVSHLSLTNGIFYLRHIDTDGQVDLQQLPEPKGPYAVAPMLKFFIADYLQKGQKLPSSLHFIVVKNGDLESIELELQRLGLRPGPTKPFSESCEAFELQPSSILLAAAVPPGQMCFGLKGSRPMLEAVGKMHRLSPKLSTQLIKYQKH